MRCKFRAFIKYWTLPIIYEILIFYLSSKPSPEIGPEIHHIDKFFHTIIYFIFALLLWRAFFYASPEFFKKRAIFFTLTLTIFFGISDELHQYFVPFRDADVFDILFDCIGACMAILSVIWYKASIPQTGITNPESNVLFSDKTHMPLHCSNKDKNLSSFPDKNEQEKSDYN